MNSLSRSFIAAVLILLMPGMAHGAVTGACCIDTGCGVATQSDCEAAGGVYLGDGTSCAGSPCSGPTGACCMEAGHCTVKSQLSCELSGGTWEGEGTTCTPNPCPQAPTGACCLSDGTCVVKSAVQCATQGGTYHGDAVPCGATCSTTPTPFVWPGGHRFGLYLAGREPSDSQVTTLIGLLGVPKDSLWLAPLRPDTHGWHLVKPSSVSYCVSYSLPPHECYACADTNCFRYVPWDSCCYYYAVPPRGTPPAETLLNTWNFLFVGYDSVLADSVTSRTLTGHLRSNRLDSLYAYVDWLGDAYGTLADHWILGNEVEAGSWRDTPTNYFVMCDSVRAHLRATMPDAKLGVSFSLPGLGIGSNPSAESWWTAAASHPNSFDFVDWHWYNTREPPDTILARWNSTAPGKEFIVLECGVNDSTLDNPTPQLGGSQAAQARDLPKLLVKMFSAGAQRISVGLIDTSIGKFDEIFLHTSLVDEGGTIKPAFWAYQTAIRKLDRFTRVTKYSDGQYRFDFETGDPTWVLWSGNVPRQFFTDRVRVTTYNGTTYHTCSSALELDPPGAPIYVQNDDVQRWQE